MECRRSGSSNGIPVADDDFMKFLHMPGALPRKALGTHISKQGWNWQILYKSPYEPASSDFKQIMYAPPCPGGAIMPNTSMFPDELRCFLVFYGRMKIFLPPLLDDLNHHLPQKHRVAQSAIRRETASISSVWEKCGGDNEEMYYQMAFTHSLSLLEYAVAKHRDVPKTSSRVSGDYSMMEYKFIFEDSHYAGLHKQQPTPLARLRGGAGGGRAAYGVTTHSPST